MILCGAERGDVDKRRTLRVAAPVCESCAKRLARHRVTFTDGTHFDVCEPCTP